MGIPGAALSIPNPGWCLFQQAQTPPVTFSFITFTTMFPEFSCLIEAQGQAYFNLATIYCPNVPQNPFNCSGVLAQLLYLVTAHVAWLLSPKDANGNPTAPGQGSSAAPLVGRISQATQGSVNLSLEFDGTAGGPSEQFFSQTQYGLMFWQATASIRSARSIANPTIVPGVVYPSAPWLPGSFWGAGFGLTVGAT
jgi:hypothetical protein